MSRQEEIKTILKNEEESSSFNTSSKLYFFDISKSGILDPKTKKTDGKADIALLKNEEAVVESVYNILMTEPGERPMRPDFGCGLNRFLFEPIDNVTALELVNTISRSIELYEPRILDYDIVITPLPDKDTFEIKIYLTVNTKDEQIELTTELEKIR